LFDVFARPVFLPPVVAISSPNRGITHLPSLALPVRVLEGASIRLEESLVIATTIQIGLFDTLINYSTNILISLLEEVISKVLGEQIRTQTHARKIRLKRWISGICDCQ